MRLKIDKLTHFRGNRTTNVIPIDVAMTGIVGRNDHGKSTVLKALLMIFAVFMPVSAFSGPPPYPKDLGTPNILQPIKVIGGYGTGLGQFNEPHGVDFSRDGRILITDMHNNRICLLTPAFEFDRCVVPRASGQALSSPTIAKWTGPDTFVVADTGNRRLVILNLAGDVLRTSTKQDGFMSEPTGLAVTDDRFFVSDKSGQRVHILDRNLNLIRSVGGPGDAAGQFVDPSSVATDGKDRVFVADSYNNRIQILDTQGNFIGKFGDWGSFTGLLANPSSVAYSSSFVFVADLINHRIQVFSEEGRYAFQWGRHPIINHEGNGRLHYPEQIGVNQDASTAIVCEPFEHRCQIFAINNASNIIKVDDRAWWDKNGRFHYGARPTISGDILAISEPDTHSVLLFDLSDPIPRFVSRLGGQGRDLGNMVKPSGVAISPDMSTVYVSDSGNFRIESFDIRAVRARAADKPSEPQKIVRTASTLSLVQQLKPLVQPQALPESKSPSVVEPSAIRFGPKGTILMCDPVNGRIIELSPDLTPLRYFIERAPRRMPGFRPNDLAFSPSGDRVYVVDFYHSRIGIFDAKGKYIGQFGSNGTKDGQFIHAFGVAVANDGSVYVSDEALNRVTKFDRNGKWKHVWGSWGAAPGQFYKPKGIAYDAARDRLVVADFGNHRAQIFDGNGNFVSTFGIGQGYVPYTLGQPMATAAVAEGGDLPSNGGNFVINYRFDNATFFVGKDYQVDFNVRKYNGDAANDSIIVRISAVMPSHYHGLAEAPLITRAENGDWKASKINFHMPGYWQVFFDIDNGIVTERAQFDVMVQ